MYFIYFCWVFVLLRLFSSCGEWQQLFVTMCRLLLAAASLAVERGPRDRGLQESRCTGSVAVAPQL